MLREWPFQACQNSPFMVNTKEVAAAHRCSDPLVISGVRVPGGFPEEGFRVLLNPVTGFEILECSAGLPSSIVPFGHEEAMMGLCEQPADLGISVIAKKIGPSDRRLAWDVDVSEILDTTYPSSRPRGT